MTAPLRTIQAAADRVMPGDTVMIHGGVYREAVTPRHGGISPNCRVIFMSSPGETVVIKGSERVTDWREVADSVWTTVLPNDNFGKFNPYADTLHGDWLASGQWSHTGEVYINERIMKEVENRESLFSSPALQWYCEVKGDSTYITARFGSANPCKELAEINVRRYCFYPDRPFVDYITVRGLKMMQAATPFAPPTTEQVGLVGTHWSKGWIIEDNEVCLSKCSGITLGRYGDEWDNRMESEQGFVECTQRAYAYHWDKEHVGSHIVRRNHIHDCGQGGIIGSFGAAYSTIENNVIHSMSVDRTFWGYELAGIKLHGAVDVDIIGNHIYNVEGGIWLDWMAQGTRVSRNLLHDNRVVEVSLEVDHGPILLDNNLFLSPILSQIKLSQGVAMTHNLIAWEVWRLGEEDARKTPYLDPHSTRIAGFHPCVSGNAFYYNNIFTRSLQSEYDKSVLPVAMNGNCYFGSARPSRFDETAMADSVHQMKLKIKEKDDGWYLSMQMPEKWSHEATRRMMTTADLGRAIVPNQSFSRDDRHPQRLDMDYFGRKRGGKRFFPGPFNEYDGRIIEIKVYDK